MEENVRLSLLSEVRCDALVKSQGTEQGEKFFEFIRLMCKLNRLARKEGLLAVAEADISSEIALNSDIRQALDLFVETALTDDLTKHLTDQYWAKNFHGENALLYYMVILSVINTQLGKMPTSWNSSLYRVLMMKAWKDMRRNIMTDNKKAEAVARMKKIGISNEAIKNFTENCIINQSLLSKGEYSPLREEQLCFAKELEKKYGILVYFVIQALAKLTVICISAARSIGKRSARI